MNKKILVLFAFITANLSINAQECENLSLDVNEASCIEATSTIEAKFKNTEYRTSIDYMVTEEEIPCPPSEIRTPPVGISLDDRFSQIINIGFTFCFYGNEYDQILVNDNGFVTFDLSVPHGPDSDQQFYTYDIPDVSNLLPSPNEQPNAIYACWVDTYAPEAAVPGDAIQFRKLNLDQPGNRIFVVDWKNVPLYRNRTPDDTLDASLYLYETSNVIETNIYNVGSSSTNDGRALVGIQNKSATLGFSAPGRDSGTWPATDFDGPEKWRFIPNGDQLNYDFQWYADLDHDGNFTSDEKLFENGEFVPNFIEVNPDVETAYQAEVIVHSECAGSHPITEVISVSPLPPAPEVTDLNDLYLCKESVDADNNPQAIFNLAEEDPLSQFSQEEKDNLYNIVYYYIDNTPDGDKVVIIEGDTTDANGNTVPLIEYFESIDREIFVLIELDCSKDFDGDGINNCDDPFPRIFCDVNDPSEDCDGDGINNGIDTAPLVYGPCDEDSDGDGINNCDDPYPNIDCNVNNPRIDCDGDGLLNGVDPNPLVAEPSCDILDCTADCDNDGILNCDDANPNDCDSTSCSGDCDNDGILNCVDPNPNDCDPTACSGDCDNDGILNCLDIYPEIPFMDNSCNIREISFNINVLKRENPDFSYDPLCSNNIIAPPNLPNYDNPGIVSHIYEINNGGVWLTPLLTDSTKSLDGILDLNAINVLGTDNGNFTIIHTITITHTIIETLVDGTTTNFDVECTDTKTIDIYIDEFEDASFTYPSATFNDPIYEFCVGDVDALPNNDAITTGYSINNGGDIDPITGEINLDINTGTQPGIYTVTHTLNGNGVCEDIKTVEIEVFPKDNAAFSYPTYDFCSNNTNITDYTAVLTSDTSAGTFEIDNGGHFTNETTGQIDLTASGAGTFHIRYNTSGHCTVSSNWVEITISTFVDSDFTYPTEVCLSDTEIAAEDYEDGGVFSINPSNSSSPIINPVTGELTITNSTTPGNYNIIYSFDTGGLCESITTKIFTIHNVPVAGTQNTIPTECNVGSGTADFNVSDFEDEILNNQNSVSISYFASFEDASNDINELNTAPALRVNGNVFARLENQNGCFSISEIYLIVEDCYAILPEAFSPNSNLTENQTFNIRNLRTTYPKFTISIYNRHGQIVFEGDSTSDNWNGKLNNDGELLPVGTYFYALKLNDDLDLKYRGWVYLQE